ncbi:MAG: nucleotide sugar dehydrogenase [candidate division WOR-3 bacterium]|nr:nucleotide sugar dehydrogenase [candidate division WOR-3 bacterium]MCX7837206.1 nucleotide sugar dehydrogenase [candidate division WOR-3 bacterium]MDW8114598.1 nucleotide sugar dehydrogenase [candidate division WOR-3 bacterium]
MDLKEKILKKEAIVGIIGLGYVGLPLAIAIGESGFKVIGIDVDKNKVNKVNKGESYLEDVKSEDIKNLLKKGLLKAYYTYEKIKECDIINIAVPTPFTTNKDPDISYIIESGKEISKRMRKGQLIILRSTTYPETTEKVLKPILDESGLKIGKDYFLSFAPERVDPGNKIWTIKNTPIVVGGITEKCTYLTKIFYEKVVDKVFIVSSPRVAEMAKLLENIFRSVNIALVNELALLCERMGNINVWEVIAAASTKPFGFMPFYPGPGIGGHCILVDPYYLSWKAREYDFHLNFIELAAETNEYMPFFVVNKLFDILGQNKIKIKESEILILGAAFKRNVSDTRNSPAIKIISLLEGKVKKIYYNDPYVPILEVNNKKYYSVKLSKTLLKKVDCVLIVTDHSIYDYDWLLKNAKLIFDTRNAIKKKDKKVYLLGCNI